MLIFQNLYSLNLLNVISKGLWKHLSQTPSYKHIQNF
jgi:hypothetical protein